MNLIALINAMNSCSLCNIYEVNEHQLRNREGVQPSWQIFALKWAGLKNEKLLSQKWFIKQFMK